jgi:hypothetical protein
MLGRTTPKILIVWINVDCAVITTYDKNNERDSLFPKNKKTLRRRNGTSLQLASLGSYSRLQLSLCHILVLHRHHLKGILTARKRAKEWCGWTQCRRCTG